MGGAEPQLGPDALRELQKGGGHVEEGRFVKLSWICV